LQSIAQRNDDHVPAVFAVWAMAASIAVHGLLSAVKMHIGKRARSVALTADAWHDLVDLFSGCVALVAVLLSVSFQGLRAADHYGGFAIGLIVIFLGLRVARETTLQLMDTMPDDEQMQQIRAVASRVPGALAIEKCFARKTGLRYHVDLHLEVDPHLTVLESHQIAHAVQLRITTELDWVADVLVHVEPHLAVRPADWPAAKVR
jgi:cation diffusion facilitator family transporter